MAWIEELHRAKAELEKRDADPLREKVEAFVRGMEGVSTFALLDLLGLPKNTGNARRIGTTMRSLGFIPIKSRRLMPGGYRDTVTRGWARPVRTIPNEGNKAGSLHLKTTQTRRVSSEAENMKTAGGCL